MAEDPDTTDEIDVTGFSLEQIKYIRSTGAYVTMAERPFRTSCASCDEIIFSKNGRSTPDICPWCGEKAAVQPGANSISLVARPENMYPYGEDV